MENNRKPPELGNPYPPFSAGLVGPVETDLYNAMLKAQEASGAASTAQEAAEDAQEAAETAQGKAEDAQEAAEDAQGDAETAQAQAEAWATGGSAGTPSATNNAKYYSEQAASSAASVAASAAQIETNKENISNLNGAFNSTGITANLLPFDYYSGDTLTNNGITFVKDTYGTVRSSGTASGQARYYWCYKSDKIEPGEYEIGGMAEDSSGSTIGLEYAITDGTPAVSDYTRIFATTSITVGQGKLVSIRTGYTSGYVDNGNVWNVFVRKKLPCSNNDSRYNPFVFVPKIQANEESANKFMLLYDRFYTPVSPTWKVYKQSESSTYDYIKATPLTVDNKAVLQFTTSDTHIQFDVVKYGTVQAAQSGYDAEIGIGTFASQTGWLTDSSYTITPGYYLVIVKSTNQSVTLSDGNTVAVTLENDIAEGASDLSVPVFEDKETALISAVTAAKSSGDIVFCIAADPHYNTFDFKDCHQTGWAKRMSYLANEIGADFVAVLGDMVEGYNDYISVGDYRQQYVNSERIQAMINAYTANGLPFMYVAGHHEAYPITEASAAAATLDDGVPFVQNRAFYSSELKPMAYGVSTLVRMNTTKTYAVGHRKLVNKIVDIADPNTNTATLNKTGASISYYFDITKSGTTTRFLVVDGCFFTYGGYDPDTVTFVASALTDAASNGYKVIVFNHIPLRAVDYFLRSSGSNAVNEDAFINVLKNSGANIVAYIHGHIHADNIVTAATEREDTHTYPYSDIPFPMVGVSCQKTGGVAGPYIGDYTSYGIRTVDAYTGYCFDTVIYHPDTGTLDFYRFGAGDSGTYPTRSVS